MPLPYWVGFIAAVLLFLALDLGVFHKRPHAVGFREAFSWTGLWFTLAMVFGFAVFEGRPRQEFITGYLIELSLSMDNVFVIALIFNYFRVDRAYQHRVLFWGIMGALVMRGVMILAGAALVKEFHWILYVFGGFLILTGIKMCFGGDEGVDPEKNPVVRLARRWFPISQRFEGQKFTTVIAGKRMLTPMAVVLIMIETTDLVFAVDSIPAIFGVTQDAFIVFTSNIFAILGLRSLYFVLSGLIGYFSLLKYGLALVLVFIGGKMLAEIWHVKVPVNVSLGVVVAIIVGSILFSIVYARWSRKRHGTGEQG